MKLIILDRDGVINHDSLEYIKSPREWQPIAGSLKAIARLTDAGYTLAVATNQSGIARGYYDESILVDIHAKMRQLVAQAGGVIDSIWHCPHMPDSGCDCRKPAPGLLLSIARHYQVDLEHTYFVGDRDTDIKAAHAVSARAVLIDSPMTDYAALPQGGGYLHYASLLEFTHALLNTL